MFGDFNISLSGTFAATVDLQRSFDSGSTWHTIESYTVPTQKVGSAPERGVQYRMGVATGAYTNGTAVVRVSQ